MFQNIYIHPGDEGYQPLREYESCSPRQAYHRGFADGLKAAEQSRGLFEELLSEHRCYRGDRNFPDAYRAGYYAARGRHH